MLNNIVGIILFCALFSAAWTWALVWIIERKENGYAQGALSFSDAFLVGAFALIFIYLTNFICLFAWPDRVVYYDLALATALAGFGLYRETLYKARASAGSRKLKAEARRLEAQIKKEPLNAAYFERLSEVLEKLGKKRKAAEAARHAAELDPTVRNSLRVKHLGGK
jgi:hypothetical protein